MSMFATAMSGLESTRRSHRAATRRFVGNPVGATLRSHRAKRAQCRRAATASSFDVPRGRVARSRKCFRRQGECLSQARAIAGKRFAYGGTRRSGWRGWTHEGASAGSGVGFEKTTEEDCS